MIGLCLFADLQAEESSHSHFNKALDYLNKAISAAQQIDQEELRIGILAVLEHEQWLLSRSESNRAKQGWYLCENSDEVICE